MAFQVHSVEWTDEKVGNFWNFYNNYPPMEDLWFSKEVGREVIRFAGKYVKIKGNILDYGIGKGHLAAYLMEDTQVELYACDFSGETIKNINNQFQNVKNFNGCSLVSGFPSGYSENQFDIVFLVEAIEHLTDDYLLPTLKEIRRILKPGGTIVVTTPNDEKLERQHVVCPDCGCVFHRVQHVRSFNPESLGELMIKHQFKKVFCGALNFTDLGKRRLLKKIRNVVRTVIGSDYKPPHLAYIGTKGS
jgi:SAM-dependent methyltransferase